MTKGVDLFSGRRLFCFVVLLLIGVIEDLGKALKGGLYRLCAMRRPDPYSVSEIGLADTQKIRRINYVWGSR